MNFKIPSPKNLLEIATRPSPRAAVPEPRQIGLRHTLIVLLKLVAIVSAISFFIIGQLALGYQASRGSLDITIAGMSIFAVFMAVVLGRDVSWRVLFLMIMFLIMPWPQKYFGGSTVTSTFVLEQLASLTFMVFLLLDTASNPVRRYPNGFVLLAFVLYALAGVASFVAQKQTSDSTLIRSYIIQDFLGVALVLGCFYYANTWKKYRAILKWLLCGAVIVSLMGIFEFFFPNQYYVFYDLVFRMSERHVEIARLSHRIIGPFTSGPELAVWLVYFLVLAFYAVVFASSFTRRIWSFVAFSLILVALFFTASRGPLVGAILSCLLFLALIGRARTALAAASVLVVLGGIGYFAGPTLAKVLPGDNMFARILGETKDTQDPLATLEVRQNVWNEGVEIWSRHKVFGIGPGEWLELRKRQARIRSADMPVSLHSGYVQTMVERGALGVLALFFLMAVIIHTGLKAVRASPQGTRRGLAAALYAACIGLMICTISEPAFVQKKNFFFVAVAVGFLLKVPIVARQEVLEPAETEPAYRRRRWVTPRLGPSRQLPQSPEHA